MDNTCVNDEKNCARIQGELFKNSRGILQEFISHPMFLGVEFLSLLHLILAIVTFKSSKF